MGASWLKVREFIYESPSISKKALRELQNYSPQRHHPRHLHQRPPQAAAGLTIRF
jgi:hypothetical protein